jgi:hypothetical protein
MWTEVRQRKTDFPKKRLKAVKPSLDVTASGRGFA